MTEEIERYEFDVVVIGAGGAGLRAAIEARAQGKRTAIISKSLFGKAHTVMAEGGCAAAMGNVNPNDNWQVHYRDTMRGGKFLNNWRMATPRRLRTASGSWRPTVRSSTAPRKARSASATSVGTPTRGWPTSVTAPAWR
jgi:glycine/D-amino acid oxidase-like deaminating enzyme